MTNTPVTKGQGKPLGPARPPAIGPPTNQIAAPSVASDEDDFWDAPLAKVQSSPAKPEAQSVPKPVSVGDSGAKVAAPQGQPDGAGAPEDAPVSPDQSSPPSSLPNPRGAIQFSNLSTLQEAERQAFILREMGSTVSLSAIAGRHFGGVVGHLGAQVFRDDLLDRCGRPTDPIEQVLIEQLALLHSQAARLHVHVCDDVGPEVLRILCGAIARLTGEIRRIALSIKEYRSEARKHVTVVKQTNLSSGDQQLAVVVQGAPDEKNPSTANTKLTSKRGRRGSVKKKSKPKTRCCRPA